MKCCDYNLTFKDQDRFIDIGSQKIDCLRFVMCLLLALAFQGFFFSAAITVLMKQRRQVVCTVKQSIFLRCLWLMLTLSPKQRTQAQRYFLLLLLYILSIGSIRFWVKLFGVFGMKRTNSD